MQNLTKKCFNSIKFQVNNKTHKITRKWLF